VELDDELMSSVSEGGADHVAGPAQECERRLVTGHDCRAEPLDPLAPGEIAELSHEAASDAVPLAVVHDLEGDLRRARIVAVADVAGRADDGAGDEIDRRDGLPAAAADIRKAVHVGLPKTRLRAMEAQTARPLRQSLEDLEERGAISTVKAFDADQASVTTRCTEGVLHASQGCTDAAPTQCGPPASRWCG
jgi:hypothetical protein